MRESTKSMAGKEVPLEYILTHPIDRRIEPFLPSWYRELRRQYQKHKEAQH
jgi:hypothetical protein